MNQLSQIHIKAILLIGLLSIGYQSSFGQKSQKYFELNETYRKALDLFEKEKFAASQSVFDEVISEANDDQSEVVANANYYKALCGLMLFNTNAENLLIEYITDFPESPKVNRAYFDLGLYQYRKRDYGRAISWFEQVDVYTLSNEELAEYYFKMGYAYFKKDQKKEALQALFEIKDAETKYSVVAKYYYAHLSYESGNLENALKYFREIESNPTFSSVIPYYITQILFGQEKYNELIEYATVILDSGGSQRSAEISKLIGESHFQLNQYKEALPFLERYVEGNAEAQVQDFYQIAKVNHELGELKQAVRWYQEALSTDDSLNQIVHYNMGEAYLELENKLMARNAMRLASKMGSDEQIHENSLYSYAKLSYELSNYPFNDAVRAFEEYINKYPDSKKLDEANEYLVGVYFTTKNYEEARKSLDRIENRGLKLNLAYQKIMLYLGIEEMNKGHYEEAIAYFTLAVQADYDRSVKIDAMFWKAEAWFRLVKYNKSIEDYNQFMVEAGAVSSKNYALAQYNLGYAYYRTRDYEKALFRFRQFISNPKSLDPKLRNDSYLRIGDTYFVTKDYKNAVIYYDRAVDSDIFDTDYALFQSALAEGVQGNYDEKGSKLSALITRHKNSLYLDDALFELGSMKFIKGKNDEALALLNQLINEHPESPYQSKAILKSGLIYFNNKNDESALGQFKLVVTNFPNTSESKEAIDKIKQIYIAKGDLVGFESYMNGIGVENISTTALDSAAYEIAENAYLNNNCEDAVSNFTLYIEKYPKGSFLLNAHYYRGECELRSKYHNEALLDFEYVLQSPKSIFTEKSLLHAANLARILDKHEQAIGYYLELEKKANQSNNLDQAHYWLMKLYFETSQENEALEYAALVLQKENLNEDIKNEIFITRGKIYLKSDQYNKAYKDFENLLAANDERAAEGKYQLAYIEYMRGNLDKSEEFINVLLNQSPSYDYWIARSFILWSDIYISRGDNYQAKVSLQTVIENYEKDDLKKVAKEKYDALVKQEELKKQKQLSKQKEMEIDFSGDDDYDYLFEEEEINELEIKPTNSEKDDNPINLENNPVEQESIEKEEEKIEDSSIEGESEKVEINVTDEGQGQEEGKLDTGQSAKDETPSNVNEDVPLENNTPETKEDE